MLSPTRLARHMMDRASAALQLAHLGSPRDVTAEDEDAFARHTVDLTADYAVLGSGFMVMAIFIWWPIDLLVGPDDRYLEAFAAMRTRGLVLMGTTLALFLCSNRARRAARVVGPLAYAALMGCIGYSLGEMGSSELSWFGNAILGVVPASLIPLRLLPRIAVTLLIGLSLPASFFFVAPDAWGAPAGPGQLSFVLFAILVTIIVGEVLHRVLRRSFFEQRALDRARERLSELNGSLADRVTAQTNELRALASRLERTQETERLRISRDLHDELAQELTAMRYTIHQLEREHGRRPEAVGLLISDLIVLLDDTMASVRGVIADLRPRVLDELGLVAAAEWLCDRARSAGDGECRLATEGPIPDVADGLDPEQALALFRVMQEAVTNAQRHAHARVIDVTLSSRGGLVTAEIADDGVGFEPSDSGSGFGLLGIRERVRAAGGRLTVVSAPGRGTRVSVTVTATTRGTPAPSVHSMPGARRAASELRESAP